MKDPVERDTDRYYDKQACFESWYEQHESELADAFYEKKGVEAFDQKLWIAFVDKAFAELGRE